MFLLFFVLLLCGLCGGDEGDLGYSLNIGYAIDVFANYGDLSQVTQVVSADYEQDDEDDAPIEPFREKNIRIFVNASSTETTGDGIADKISIQFCDTFDDLLDKYFRDFNIQGTTKPWKAFMGDWIPDEIMRTFGIEYNPSPDNCCYVLAKLSKTHRAVKMNSVTGHVAVKDYVRRAMDGLNVTDSTELRRFMKNYGTHYINSYVTGNFIYQVFKYKRTGYNQVKTYIRKYNNNGKQSDNLRFYFSSYFLKQIGDIRIASGNKTIETWARQNLRDSQYLYSRPSLLRLYYNPILIHKLNDLLDNGALLALNLKTLKPIFKDKDMGDKFSELVENDLQLWEVNA